MGTLGEIRVTCFLPLTRLTRLPTATEVPVALAVPGPRLSMRCTSLPTLVTFCAGLRIWDLVLTQGLEAGVQPGADCEGERCVTCLHGGDTTLSPAVI